MPSAPPAWSIVEGDCLRALSAMAAGSVDAVVTDPPWNLGKRYGAHDDGMAPERYVEWLGAVLQACARVCRGPIVLLPGAMNVDLVPRVLDAAGLIRRDELRWLKPAVEPVVCTGARGIAAATPRTIAVEEVPAGGEAVAGHPCPKPVGLLRVLVDLSTRPGETVLDPFAGTGTTLVAAVHAGRSAIGIELEQRFCAVARRRLEQLGSASAWAFTGAHRTAGSEL